MPLQVEDVAAHSVRRNGLTGNEPRAKRIHICLNHALCGSGVRLDAVCWVAWCVLRRRCALTHSGPFVIELVSPNSLNRRVRVQLQSACARAQDTHTKG